MADEKPNTIDVEDLSPEEQKAAREVAEEKLGAKSEQAERAQEVQGEHEDAKEKIKRLEDDPPEKLEDWPSDEAKYETFGGPEHETSYDEAATAKLGPSNVRHNEDGSVEVGGEKVDNPEDFKGDPVPGGPTDPNAKEAGIKTREDKKKELAERNGKGDDA
jgi:hypothetical protein